MKHVFNILAFAFAVTLFVQCKTERKKQTTQEPTKPTLTKIENKQDAASAIISASQTFANADCQGNASCQSVQTQAAVLASVDPSQLATVLTPDNIQQATAEITNSVTVTATSITTDTETSTNTEQKTNVSTNTSVTVVSSSQGSPAMKNAGISLISLGGGLFVLGFSVALHKTSGIKNKDSTSNFLLNLRSDLSSSFESYKMEESHRGNLEFEINKINQNLIKYLDPQSSKSESYLQTIEDSLKRVKADSNTPSKQIEFNFLVEYVEYVLKKFQLENIEVANKIRDLKFQTYSTHSYSGIFENLEMPYLLQESHKIKFPKLYSVEKPSSKKINKTKIAGISSAVFGAVVAAIGGGLYAKSGVGLAAGTANDPLTVYFTNLGQIALQLNQ